MGKDRVTAAPLGEPWSLGLAIAALDADERQDPRADRAHGLAADGDARLGDSLHECDHAMMSGISRVRSFWIWSLRTSLRFLRRRSCSWSCAGAPDSLWITSARSWCSISTSWRRMRIGTFSSSVSASSGPPAALLTEYSE